MSSTNHTVSIRQVRQLLYGAERLQCDTHRLLRRAGIAPELLSSPLSRVTQSQCAALLVVLRRHLRDELWGLCQRPLPLGSFALAGELMVGAQTVGEAMHKGARYYSWLISDFKPQWRDRQGQAELQLVSADRSAAASAFAERAFGFLAYGWMCWLAARRLPLVQVNYPDCALMRSMETSLLLGAPVHHGAAHTGWVCDGRWMALPVVQNAQTLGGFLLQAPASLLVRYRDRTSATESLRRFFRKSLAAESPSLDSACRQLAVTPQTLRRRLRAEGQTFRAVRDDLRRDVAIEHLARTDSSLVEVANMVGYSEGSTFHRAFKAWTGVSPGVYRQTQLR